jgi:hypothetical protein
MTEQESKEIISALIASLTNSHPHPWSRIERDWTYEVYDAAGGLVCKFRTAEIANAFVKVAAQEYEEGRKEIEELLRDLENL